MFIYVDKAAAIKIQMDLKKLAYVDADYRPSAWLVYMLTRKPAGNDALITMLPRLNTDNVVLTQNKAVRSYSFILSKYHIVGIESW